MNKYSKLIISAIMAVSGAMQVAAVPAKPGLMTVRQPDGTELRIRLVGDERSHFCLTEDGYLLSDNDGTYYYADINAAGAIVRSAIRAADIPLRDGVARNFLNGVDMPRVREAMDMQARRAAERRATRRPRMQAASSASGNPGLFPGNHFPAMGEQKAIVILVEYQDTKMSMPDAYDYFNRMLNEPGFSDYGGTGSAVDFFMESSMGQFRPQFDVFGPVTLKNNMSYYGGNDYYGNDLRPEEMIIEACQQLDATVDFSEYDRDGDGYIDNVFVFYAGRGEASGGASNTVWPHSWDITEATSVPYVFDGVRLDRYACSNEWEGSRPDGVGTFVHEFSHVMGLPDLYATSYTSAFTPGAWSALDYGPYNNDGCTPPLYSAFERYALGWIEPLPIEGPLNATLYPIGTNQAGIIRTSDPGEFFLVENRQQTGWDAYIPGHGMLVWHVDYNESIWSSNKVNNTASHQYVDLEEADNIRDDYSRGGDSFPGTACVTSFTDDTAPSMKTWNGTRLGLPVTDIAESAAGVITFKVCGGREPMAATVADAAADVTFESFTARWQSAGDDVPYVLSVYTGGEAGACVPGYEARRVYGATSCLVTGLEPETEYFYTVAVGDGWELSPASNEISVRTAAIPFGRRAVTAVEASDISSDGFTARWEAMDDAESYLITVYNKEWGAPLWQVCDFSDGVDRLPEGWSANTGGSYANSAYSGAAAPALRLGLTGDAVTSPEYVGGVRSLSFWHRGNGSSPADRVDVSAFANGEWQIVAQLPVLTDKGGTVYTVGEDEMPAGANRIRIEYVRTGTRGAVAIDDITVEYGETFTPVPVVGLSDYPAGSATYCAIGGLAPDTDYYYTVSACDKSGEHSLSSNEVAVRTLHGAGVDAIGVDAVRIVASGLTIYLSDAVPYEKILVADIAGRIVGEVAADSEGRASVMVASAGVYVVRAGAMAAKVVLR